MPCIDRMPKISLTQWNEAGSGKSFVTNMLIVFTKLLIYKRRKKVNRRYLREVLYLMYKEYKADQYNAEITDNRELDVVIGEDFLLTKFIQLRK